MKKLLVISFLFLFMIIFPAWAILPPEVKKDLSPLSALVIGLDGETVILDKGRAQGVKLGDIFTIYRKGKPVIHPQTKEVLGYLKNPVAKAEIVRVEENFATGRLTYKKEDFPIPSPAIRFGDQKILLIAPSASEMETLIPELKEIFSQSHLIVETGKTLGALSPAELGQKKIDFVLYLGQGELRLYNPRLELIRAYTFPLISPPPPGLTAPRTISPHTQRKPQTYTSPTPPSAPTPSPSVSNRYPYSTLRYTQPSAPVFRREGRLPQVIIDFEMGDLDEDGKPEIVYLTPKALYVARYRGGLLAKYQYRGFGKVLNFSLGPRGWLALNVYVDKEGLRSELLKFDGRNLRPEIKNLNLILSFADFNGDGRNDTLLGQTYSPENFFGHKVYILGRRGNQITYQKELKVPEGFRLIGSAFADLDGDGYLETIFINKGHKLAVYRYTTKLWLSNRKVGGSSYVIKASAGPYRQTYKLTIPAEVNFLTSDLNGDGRKEVILVANESSHRDLLPGIPAYSSGEVLVLTYSTTGFELLPISGKFEGPIQGLGIYGQELFVALAKGNPFTQEGESYLLALPLKMPGVKASGPQDVYRATP